MRLRPLHAWDLTPKQAIALQRDLSERVDTRSRLKQWRFVAGADVSYKRFSNVFYAAVVVLDVHLNVVESQSTEGIVTFPYVPGLLSFRELPILLEAFAKIKQAPDVVICDGHGVAHPRRFGIACHLGLWLDRPTLGCAKSVLIGNFSSLGRESSSVVPLMEGEQQIGAAVRTRKGVRPVFVSVGHCIHLADAVRVTLETSAGYRIPEPTRQAHLRANELRQSPGSKRGGYSE